MPPLKSEEISTAPCGVENGRYLDVLASVIAIGVLVRR